MESFISGCTSPAEAHTGCARREAVKALHRKSWQLRVPCSEGSVADSRAGSSALTLENTELFSKIRCVQTRRQRPGKSPACAWLDRMGTDIGAIAMEIKLVKHKLILMF